MEKTLSVKDFAKETGRFPNQIYMLVRKGNQFRKLRHITVNKKLYIPVGELTNFPFTPADAVRIKLTKKIKTLQNTVRKLRADLWKCKY